MAIVSELLTVRQEGFGQSKCQNSSEPYVETAENASETLEIAQNRSNLASADVTLRLRLGFWPVRSGQCYNVLPIVSVVGPNYQFQLLPTLSSMFSESLSRRRCLLRVPRLHLLQLPTQHVALRHRRPQRLAPVRGWSLPAPRVPPPGLPPLYATASGAENDTNVWLVRDAIHLLSQRRESRNPTRNRSVKARTAHFSNPLGLEIAPRERSRGGFHTPVVVGLGHN